MGSISRGGGVVRRQLFKALRTNYVNSALPIVALSYNSFISEKRPGFTGYSVMLLKN